MSARRAPRPGGVTVRRVVRLGDAPRPPVDEIAVEEPLEIHLDGEPVATTMRTPGRDVELALGLLWSEGIVRSLDDLGSIAPCGRPGARNVIDVRAAPGARLEPDTRRGLPATSACGVCGRLAIAELVARAGRVESAARVDAALVVDAVARLGECQPGFAATGGLHAASAHDAAGARLAAAEDVGRHNAVDKVIGALLRARALDRAVLLAVSGRIGFEIVQKAAAARIPIVAAVGAASSLAIDLAERCGVTLAAFVRGRRLNLYAHEDRIAAAAH